MFKIHVCLVAMKIERIVKQESRIFRVIKDANKARGKVKQEPDLQSTRQEQITL